MRYRFKLNGGRHSNYHITGKGDDPAEALVDAVWEHHTLISSKADGWGNAAGYEILDIESGWNDRIANKPGLYFEVGRRGKPLAFEEDAEDKEIERTRIYVLGVSECEPDHSEQVA